MLQPPTPEPQRIDWMLHSSEVDDSALADVLIEHFLPDLERMAWALSENAADARRLVVQALARAVLERRRFWGELSLQAWVLRILIQEHRRQLKASPSRLQTAWEPLSQRLPDLSLPAVLRKKRLPDLSPLAVKLRSQAPLLADTGPLADSTCVLLALWYGVRMPGETIAQALGWSEARLYNTLNGLRRKIMLQGSPSRLGEVAGIPGVFHLWALNALQDQANHVLPDSARRALEQHLTGCPACQVLSRRLESFESQLLAAFPPPPSLLAGEDQLSPRIEAGQPDFLAAQVMQQVAAGRDRKRLFIPLREALLVAGVLAAVLFAGLRLELFSTGDLQLRLFPTPLPTSVPTLAPPDYQKGIEGVDYIQIVWYNNTDSPAKVAELTGLAEEEVSRLNSSTDLYQPYKFFLHRSMDAMVFVNPVFRPAPPPLPAEAGLDEVIQRTQESQAHWQTIWLDMSIIHYGPPGYLDAPVKVDRQLFVGAQPHRWMWNISPLDEELNVSMFYYDDHYLSGFGGIDAYQWSPVEQMPPELVDFLKMPLPPPLPGEKGRFELAGRDIVAGREVVGIKWYDIQERAWYRFWIDAVYGVPLRLQLLDGTGAEVVVVDAFANTVQFNLTLPTDIFFPGSWDQTGSYPAIYRGVSAGRAELPSVGSVSPVLPQLIQPAGQRHPPAGYDVSHAPTYLAWPPKDAQDQAVRIFAGDYLLGNVEVEGERFISCARSPDGKLLAFSVNHPPAGISLYVLHLEPSLVVEEVNLAVLNAVLMAFSPDNRRLALLACLPGSGCQLQIYYPDNAYLQEIKYLVHGKDLSTSVVSSIEWSEDGDYLLLSSSNILNQTISVVNARSGNVDFSFTSRGNIGTSVKPSSAPVEIKYKGPPDLRPVLFSVVTTGSQGYQEGCLFPPSR